MSITSLSLVRRHFVLATLVAVAVSLAVLNARDLLPTASASGEERTISFFNIHNKETITITYKKDGRYIPSALKKLNHFLRDWRTNVPRQMDPKLFDLIWELRQELGSKEPTHLISGFRSAKTNAMLRRSGRKVARRSYHIKGQAADIYMPDVPLAKLRAAALVRQVGGVGYYPRSAKYGFVHVDTGNVRHWPRLSKAKLASIFRNHKRQLKHNPRQNDKAPVYLAQRNKANDNNSVAASPENIPQRTAQAYPLPRPKPVIAAATPEIVKPKPAKPVLLEPATPSFTVASLTPSAAPTPKADPAPTSAPAPLAQVEGNEPPKLRRSLVFFPLAVLKQNRLDAETAPEPEEKPLSIAEANAVPTVDQSVEFVLMDTRPSPQLSTSQMARVARQVVTRSQKSRLMMTQQTRPTSNQSGKGQFLNAATDVIDLRGPTVSPTAEEVEESAQVEAIEEDTIDVAGEQPVAIPIPAGAPLSYR